MMLREIDRDTIFMSIQGFFNKNLDTTKFLRVSFDITDSSISDGLYISLIFLKRNRSIIKSNFMVYYMSSMDTLKNYLHDKIVEANTQ